MPIKYTLLLLLLVCGHCLAAQDMSLQKQVDRIDSLILYSSLLEAENAADQVNDQLAKGPSDKNFRELKLAVMLNKAHLQIVKEEFSEAIEIVLKVIDEAQEYQLPEIEFKACLLAALVYEISEHYILCKAYLDRSFGLYSNGNAAHLYSTYCIRTSSYYRFVDNKDSALYYAYKGLHYAHQYANRRDISDAYIMLSILLGKTDFVEGIRYASLAAKAFTERNDFAGVASMHGNIAKAYHRHREYKQAFLHNDTALALSRKHALADVYHAVFLKHRHEIFDSAGNRDSAYFYFKAYHHFNLNALKDQETTEIRRITERYQNDKKESLLKSKDQQLAFIITLLAVIAVAAVFLIRKNRKINVQNKVISSQVKELMQMLEQKQLLLSELQHRVKNNLQHGISILEIQKESIDFNNIEELIRGNQNRIHSMALLHKKLNVLESVNEVYLEKYIIELSELVKTSYDMEQKKISLHVTCAIEKMLIEKALPLGFIIVELVSNSMKHAFSKQPTGAIHIGLTQNEKTGQTSLHYTDNGQGFDFYSTGKKGIGMEIIRGLTGQLNATAVSGQSNGFELTISFI